MNQSGIFQGVWTKILMPSPWFFPPTSHRFWNSVCGKVKFQGHRKFSTYPWNSHSPCTEIQWSLRFQSLWITEAVMMLLNWTAPLLKSFHTWRFGLYKVLLNHCACIDTRSVLLSEFPETTFWDPIMFIDHHLNFFQVFSQTFSFTSNENVNNVSIAIRRGAGKQ